MQLGERPTNLIADAFERIVWISERLTTESEFRLLLDADENAIDALASRSRYECRDRLGLDVDGFVWQWMSVPTCIEGSILILW